MGESKLVFYLKHEIEKKFIMELKIYQVFEDERYPEGVKYSLVFIEPKTKKRVLMDNHTPKGHHYHLDALEFNNIYTNDEALIEKFKQLVFAHMGVKL